MTNRTVLVASLVAFTSIVHAEPPGDGPSLPNEDARPAATRAQAIDAFAKDCHATLKTTQWYYDEQERVDECLVFDLQQNCNPDIYGCYGDLGKCMHACQPKCTRCQDACATSCDDCKSACQAGDTACARKCAEGRADCRGRCISGLELCQGSECGSGENECNVRGDKRARACDASVCNAYVACLDVQTDEDYDKAMQACAPKAKGFDDFCEFVCRMQGIPSGGDTEQPALITAVNGKELAKRCTADSQCPTDYAAVAPYLGSFCAGTTSDESLQALSAAVTHGTIKKRTLGLVFNAYAAMYGYEFKKEKWMNGFFYGAGAAWLPESCRVKLKTVGSAKVMPFRLTVLRDKVKKIWDATP